MHARIENNTVAEWPIANLRQHLGPGVLLPADLTRDDALPDGYVYVHSSAPPAVQPGERLQDGIPVFHGGRWVQQWIAVPMTEQELQAQEIAEQERARAAVPTSVTMRQARLALLSAGLLDDVDAAINAMSSPQKEAARIEWGYSQEVQRHNGFVSVLAPMLGLSDAQTDALFVGAAQL